MYKNIIAVVAVIAIIGLATAYTGLENNRESIQETEDTETEINEESPEDYLFDDEDEEDWDDKSDEDPEIENGGMTDLINCLADNGLVIYGSEWCPACTQLAESFGGYDAIEPIYVECTEYQEKCSENQKTDYIPEIQIEGELYEGGRTPQDLADKLDCNL